MIKLDNGITRSTGDGRYLRLDASNDPITEDFEISKDLHFTTDITSDVGTSVKRARFIWCGGLFMTSTTGLIDSSNDIRLITDNGALIFGTGQDANITYDGNSLNVTANAVTAADTLNIAAGNIALDDNLIMHGATLPSFAVKGAVVAYDPDSGSLQGTFMHVQIPDQVGAFGGFSLSYDTTIQWLFGVSKGASNEKTLAFFEDGLAANSRFELIPGGAVHMLTNDVPFAIGDSQQVQLEYVSATDVLNLSGPTNFVYQSPIRFAAGPIIGIGGNNTTLTINSDVVTNNATVPTFADDVGSMAITPSTGNGILYHVQIPDLAGRFGGFSTGYGAAVSWLIGQSKNITDTTAFSWFEDASASNIRLQLLTGGGVAIPQDGDKLLFGVGGDWSISTDGTNLDITREVGTGDWIVPSGKPTFGVASSTANFFMDVKSTASEQFVARFDSPSTTFAGFLVQSSHASGQPFIQLFNTENNDRWTVLMDITDNFELRHGTALGDLCMNISNLGDVTFECSDAFKIGHTDTTRSVNFWVVDEGRTVVDPQNNAGIAVQTAEQFIAKFIGEDASFAGFQVRSTTAGGVPFVQLYNSNNADYFTMQMNTSGDYEVRNGTAVGTLVFRINNSDVTAIGNPGTTDLTIEADGDTYWVGEGSGIPYGHMYTNTTIAVTITDTTPVEVGDTWTTGKVNLVTFGASHYLTVDKAGLYKIDWSVSIAQNSPGAAIECEQGIMIDGVAQAEGRTHRTIANSSDTGASAGTAILDLAANKQISLYVANATNNTNIDVEHANVTVTMVGGT